MSPRRPVASLVVLAVLATTLVTTSAIPAAAAPFDVYRVDRQSGGNTIVTRRIELPHATFEFRESREIEYLGRPALRCEQYITRGLDVPAILAATGDSQLSTATAGYSPTFPNNFPTFNVVDLAEFSAAAGRALGEGPGIVVVNAVYVAEGADPDCRFTEPANAYVPAYGVERFPTQFDVGVAAVPDQDRTFRFTPAARHPYADDIAWTYRMRFENGAVVPVDGSATHTFTTAPDTPWYGRWEAFAIDENGNILARAEGIVGDEPGELGGEWFRIDPVTQDVVKKGDTAPVRLRVDNGTGEVLSDLELVSVSVVGSGDEPGEAVLTRLAAPREPGGQVLTLPEGLDASGPGSVGFAEYDLEGVEAGEVTLTARVAARDPEGLPVTGTIEEVWEVRRTDIEVEITFDPPEQVQEDNPDPKAEPVPVEMTATLQLTNTSGETLTGVRIDDFHVSRAFGEQQLFLEQTGGYPVTNGGILLAQEADDVPEPFDLADGASRTFTADFVARDDGHVNFRVLALGGGAGNRAVQGAGETQWIVAAEKYLEVTTEVSLPRPGSLLKAGEDIVVTGRVENLSQTASIEVGPLLPQPTGNTGLMSLAYGTGHAPDPRLLQPLPELTLGAGDSELFEVRIVTNHSDPRTNFDTSAQEAAPTGGTRATLVFDPWGIATELDGVVRTVRTDPQGEEDRGVKLAETHATLIASIDDSIPLPEIDFVLLAGGISLGAVRGVGNAGIALLYGVVDAVKLPYSILHGTWEYQAKVWDSFTEQEKTEFAAGTASVALRASQRTVELGLMDAGDLWQQINDHVYREMTGLANEWETGDYLSTAEVYAAGAGEAIGSVALPMALTRLSQTPRAAAALARAQDAVNARMAPLFVRARQIQYVEDALPLLRALENGAEISADAMRTLYGVSPEEVAELQRLAAKYDVLLTVRSRHQSSLEWIRKFGAMLKPEALKIKSVSELDVKLGYRGGDLGSVVFKKPGPLRQIEQSGGDLQTAVRQFVRERGFVDGTPEFDDAIKRMDLRVEEWKKYETAYKQFDAQKSIPTDFNYEGNAIPDMRSLSSRNKRTGFKLDEVGDDEFVVRLLDPKDGKYKRVTGDIDPIAFTNLDGSPLSGAQHKELMDAMRSNALLKAQHPESATFVKGGEEFVLGQFKPGEPGMQIGPKGPARVVRLDTSKSRWRNPRDFHLHWEGGYVHTGGNGNVSPAAAVRPDFNRDVAVVVPERIAPKPLELGEAGEATYGRCSITVTTSQTAPAIFLNESGEAVEAAADGALGPSATAAACLDEGPPTTLRTAPAAVVQPTGGSRSSRSSAARAVAADTIVLVAGTGSPELFAVGQQVLVGAQDGRGEIGTVEAVDGRTVQLDRTVDARAGDVVVMTAPARVDSPPAAGVERVAGGDRVATAIAVSKAAFASAGTVVLARADAYPDALAGAPLAHALGGPILLSDPTVLRDDVAAEIARLGASEVVVLGGDAAVAPAVVQALESGGLVARRVAGATRFATAAEVAGELGEVDGVYVVEGANADANRGWPDALAVAPVAARQGRPILLTTRDVLPAETSAAIAGLGVDAVTVVGGEVAVSGAVVDVLEAVATVTRVAGGDRYDTAARVAASVPAVSSSTWLATGRSFPDALAAGPAVAVGGDRLLLVDGQDVASATSVLDRAGPLSRVRVLGGPVAISDEVLVRVAARVR